MGEIILGLIVVLALLVALFFIFREVLLWYWKINEVVGLLTRIARALEANSRVQSADVTLRRPVPDTFVTERNGDTESPGSATDQLAALDARIDALDAQQKLMDPGQPRRKVLRDEIEELRAQRNRML